LVDVICKSSVHNNQENSNVQNNNYKIDINLKIETLINLFVDKPQWKAILLQNVLARPGGLVANEAPKAWILLLESLVCVDLGQRLGTRLNDEELCQVHEQVDSEKQKTSKQMTKSWEK